MQGLQYGVDPLLSLWLGQDTLAGEDGMGDLPPGMSPVDWLRWSRGASGLTNQPVGSRLLSGESITPIRDPEKYPGRGELPKQPEPPRAIMPDLVRPGSPAASPAPLLDLTPGAGIKLPWESPALRDPAAETADRAAMQDKAGLPSPAPSVVPPGNEAPGSSVGPASPANAYQQALLQMLLGGGKTGGGAPGGQSLDRAMQSAQASPEFANNMRQRLAEYEQNNQPLTVPEPTPFDRAPIDKWLEQAAPKEPTKRTWQDMLMDIGIGMTIGGAQGGRGWNALGPILAGGAKGFAEGRQQEKEDRREFERSQRQYAGQRAGVEADLESARTRRADELARLRIDVDRANRGDKLSQVRLGMEVDKAIEDSRRGNESLALQKFQILSQNSLAGARLQLARESLKMRTLTALAKVDGGMGAGKGPQINVGDGLKLPISALTDQQAVNFHLPTMLKRGTAGTWLPSGVVQGAEAAARQQLSQEARKSAGSMPMPGTSAYETAVRERMLPILRNWLLSDTPEAKERMKSLAAALRAQPTAMALARDRVSYRRGSQVDLLDDEDEDF